MRKFSELIEVFDAPTVHVVDHFEDWLSLKVGAPCSFGRWDQQRCVIPSTQTPNDVSTSAAYVGAPERYEIRLTNCAVVPRTLNVNNVPAAHLTRFVENASNGSQQTVVLQGLERHGVYDIWIRCVGSSTSGNCVGRWAKLPSFALLPRIHVRQGEVHERKLHVLWGFPGWTPHVQPPSNPTTAGTVDGVTTTIRVTSTKIMQPSTLAAVDAVTSQSSPNLGIEDANRISAVTMELDQCIVSLYEVEIRRASMQDRSPQIERFSVRYVPQVTALGGDHTIAIDSPKCPLLGADAIYFVRVRCSRHNGSPATLEEGAWSEAERFVCLRRLAVTISNISLNECRVSWCRRELSAEEQLQSLLPSPEDSVLIPKDISDLTVRSWKAHRIGDGDEANVASLQTISVAHGQCSNSTLRVGGLEAGTVYNVEVSWRYAACNSDVPSREYFRLCTLFPPVAPKSIDLSSSHPIVVGEGYALVKWIHQIPQSSVPLDEYVDERPPTQLGVKTHPFVTDPPQVTILWGARRCLQTYGSQREKAATLKESHVACLYELQLLHRGEELCRQLALRCQSDQASIPRSASLSLLQWLDERNGHIVERLLAPLRALQEESIHLEEILLREFFGDSSQQPQQICALTIPRQDHGAPSVPLALTFRIRVGTLSTDSLVKLLQPEVQEAKGAIDHRSVAATLASQAVFSEWFDLKADQGEGGDRSLVVCCPPMPLEVLSEQRGLSYLYLTVFNNSALVTSQSSIWSFAALGDLFLRCEARGSRETSNTIASTDAIECFAVLGDGSLDRLPHRRISAAVGNDLSNVREINIEAFHVSFKDRRTICLKKLLPGSFYDITCYARDTNGMWLSPVVCSLATENDVKAPGSGHTDFRQSDAPVLDLVFPAVYQPLLPSTVGRGANNTVMPYESSVSHSREAYLAAKTGGAAGKFGIDQVQEYAEAEVDNKEKFRSELVAAGNASLTPAIVEERRLAQLDVRSPKQSLNLSVAMVGFHEVVLQWNEPVWALLQACLPKPLPDALDGNGALRGDDEVVVGSNLNEYRLRLTWTRLPHASLSSDFAGGEGAMYKDYFFRAATPMARVVNVSSSFEYRAVISVYDKLRRLWSLPSKEVTFTTTSQLCFDVVGLRPNGIEIGWQRLSDNNDPRIVGLNPVIPVSYSLRVVRCDWERYNLINKCKVNEISGQTGENGCSVEESSLWTDLKFSKQVSAPCRSTVIPDISFGCYRCDVQPSYVYDSVGPWSPPQLLYVYPLLLKVVSTEQDSIQLEFFTAKGTKSTLHRSFSHPQVLLRAEWIGSGNAQQASQVQFVDLTAESASSTAAKRSYRLKGLRIGSLYRLSGTVVASVEPDMHSYISDFVDQLTFRGEGAQLTADLPQRTQPATLSALPSVLRKRLLQAKVSSLRVDRLEPSREADPSTGCAAATCANERIVESFFRQPFLVEVPTLGRVDVTMTQAFDDSVVVQWSRLPRLMFQLGCLAQSSQSFVVSRDAQPLTGAFDARLQVLPPQGSFGFQQEKYAVVVEDLEFGDRVIEVITPTKHSYPAILTKRVTLLQAGCKFMAFVLPLGADYTDVETLRSRLQCSPYFSSLRHVTRRTTSQPLAIPVVFSTLPPLQLFVNVLKTSGSGGTELVLSVQALRAHRTSAPIEDLHSSKPLTSIPPLQSCLSLELFGVTSLHGMSVLHKSDGGATTWMVERDVVLTVVPYSFQVELQISESCHVIPHRSQTSSNGASRKKSVMTANAGDDLEEDDELLVALAAADSRANKIHRFPNSNFGSSVLTSTHRCAPSCSGKKFTISARQKGSDGEWGDWVKGTCVVLMNGDL